MALTIAQIEAHLGNFLRLLVQSVNTPEERDELFTLTQALLPRGRAYAQNGALGTLADRKEAILAFKKAAYQRITGFDPDGSTAHICDIHWAERL